MENNIFLNKFEEATEIAETMNGAYTYTTSGSRVLDLFSMLPASRYRNFDEVTKMVYRALDEDELLTMKVIFWCRDREKQGERDLFKNIIRFLANDEKYTHLVKNNIKNIPAFGRWSDLFVLLDTPLEDVMIKYIKNQLVKDLKSEHPSLLAKWMPTEYGSNKEKKRMALKIRQKFGWSVTYYRKRLSLLRKRIDIVETKITEGRYSDIDYSKVPSLASFKYKSAFDRNDTERYNKYLEEVANGTKKMNTSTLKPIDLVRNVINSRSENNLDYLNTAWENLPDYLQGKKVNDIAVVDVSGSMTCNDSVPLFTAIALGLYLADKTTGPYSGHVITFDSNPKLIKIQGNNFTEKVRYIQNMSWGYTTNIEAVFDLILEVAIKNKLSQEDIPERLFIISDMEFNSAVREDDYIFSTRSSDRYRKVLFETIKKKFEANNYKLPRIVFWNVNSMQDNIPMKMTDDGVQLVAGSNPSLFEALLSGKFLSAYDLMLEVINSKRYDVISK